MIRRIPRALARACWAIGYRINNLGDRINLIGVKRAPPSEINKILYRTLEAQSKKIIVSSVTRSNALLDDKTVGGIDRRPSWWRQ